MHRILVPMDNSDNASRGLRYAIRLARSWKDATLHILHVDEEPLVYGEIAVYITIEKIKALQQRHSEAVLKRARAAARRARVPHESESLTGPVATTIAQRAKSLQCEMIVMGTHGSGAVGNLVMGSIATKVVHLSSVPVTLVK